MENDPTKNFRKCDGCGRRYHSDELNTVDTERYGGHWTLEICDRCAGVSDAPYVNTDTWSDV